MQLKSLELSGFKSFAKKHSLDFRSPVTAVVGPNGSGKSNVVEAIRFVLGEQSNKSMRSKAGADLIFKGSK
ncbi:MAG: AAA family ATPase, partial [Candidatus Pacebacteria bacterium]|nr:AAA family ATPase [Candidatus Paceibacterota bacterium]